MTLPSPRILFVTPSWPLGRSFGGQMRALHTARALREIGEVTVLTVGSEASDTQARRCTEEEFEIEPPIPEHVSASGSSAQRLRWIFDAKYLNVHGVSASPEDGVRLTSLLPRYDLVWVLNARTPNILQCWRWPHTHLDVDDIPSTRFLDTLGTGLLERITTSAHRMVLRRRENLYPRRFTTLSVCSETDRRYLRGDRIHVIPNGFEKPSTPPHRMPAQESPRLGFIGLYSHGPNADAVEWFLKNAWPLVLAAFPNARFRVVGKDSDGPLRPRAHNLDVLGWVDDPAAEIATWSAMVIPIRFGGGTRIKIADAFSRKCPVVATPFGAYGYEVEDRTQLRLCATPRAFADACIDLIRDPVEATRMAERAWTEFLAKWTWEAIAPRVHNAAEDCLRLSAMETAAGTHS